jgi:type II secretory pathway pseudopilin PulG
MSLIEIMVVLVILGAAIALAVPRLQRQKTQTQETLRKLTAISRDLTQSARLQSRTFRLAIKMPEPDKKEPATYWIESASGSTLVKSIEKKEEEESSIRAADDKPKAADFTLDPSFMKEPRKLPSEVKVLSVQTANDKDPITVGTAYIHFFAVGIAEEAVIQLGVGDKARWSLVVQPVTGQTDIYDREISLKDISAP